MRFSISFLYPSPTWGWKMSKSHPTRSYRILPWWCWSPARGCVPQAPTPVKRWGSGGADVPLANPHGKTYMAHSPWDARDPGAGKADFPGSHPTWEHQVNSSIMTTVFSFAFRINISEFSPKLSKRVINNLRQMSLTFAPMFIALQVSQAKPSLPVTNCSTLTRLVKKTPR